MQVLRVYSFSTFSLSPAFPPCYCPLAFRRQVRRLTSRISSESYPGAQEYVVSCHGAEGWYSDSYAPLFLWVVWGRGVGGRGLAGAPGAVGDLVAVPGALGVVPRLHHDRMLGFQALSPENLR